MIKYYLCGILGELWFFMNSFIDIFLCSVDYFILYLKGFGVNDCFFREENYKLFDYVFGIYLWWFVVLYVM